MDSLAVGVRPILVAASEQEVAMRELPRSRVRRMEPWGLPSYIQYSEWEPFSKHLTASICVNVLFAADLYLVPDHGARRDINTP
jgi:hypothetical protein